jgi:hypothetical protein
LKAVFSTGSKAELLEAEAKYAEVSDRLAGELRERIAGQAREIIRWKGGDHVGPHGFPCRRTKPFPFFICYEVRDDTIYFLALVHERRHSDFLRKRVS